jgi:transcriptional regulator with XRE-family HTH domain
MQTAIDSDWRTVSMRLTSLKLCRFERGVMQNVLARRADIAWGRLSAIENGDAEAQPDELQRIAAALQVPVDTLLSGCVSTA